MSSGQLLSVRGLQVNYGAAQALTGVSFDVGAGSVLAVVGANGAGKSSLARALSGLVQPRSGSVMLDGREVAGMPAHRIRRLGLAHVPEGRAVFGTLTVRDNLRMSQRWLKTRPARGEALERALEMFPVLGRRLGQRASTLSGGEQQMLSLACELMVTPRLVIADELSFGLAPLIIDDVYEHLLRVRELGVSLIVIEQFIQRALAMADQVLLLRRGTVAWAGPAGQTTADDLLARYIGPGLGQVPGVPDGQPQEAVAPWSALVALPRGRHARRERNAAGPLDLPELARHAAATRIARAPGDRGAALAR